MSEIIINKKLNDKEKQKLYNLVDYITEERSRDIKIYEAMPNEYFCKECQVRHAKDILIFN